MEPEKTTRIIRPEEQPEHRDPEAEGPSDIEVPKVTGLGARFRQLLEQAKQGESRP